MNIVKPNYNESITNLSNSILKHFNQETYHNTLSYIDKILDKDYKNVIVVLCDGLGSVLIDEVLDKDSFLIKNRIKTITSVFPPTTTASTTSMLSGLNPNEHGWLGWDLYFKNENKIVTMFLNTIKDTDIKAADYSLAYTTFPYESIVSKINKKYDAYELLPFKEIEYKNLDNQVNKIVELSKLPNKKFIYAYYEDPDHLLHDYGIESKIVIDEIKNINNKLEDLCNKLEDSVVIVVADHGHIDVEYYNLDNYPSIKCLLERNTSLEPRAISFKVYEDKLEEFKIEFNKYFGEEFKLFSKEEIINNKIFGIGENNKYFEDSIGDYVAISISNKAIIYDNNSTIFKSHHAGLTDREILIPVIVKEKAKVKKI